MSASNNRGRALEYKITEEVFNKYDNIKLSDRAAKDQVRDKEHYYGLREGRRNNYTKFSQFFTNWLKEFSIDDFTILDRLTDHDAKQGDPTDIRLISDAGNLNFSIKHNHYASKHQRPRATALQFGFKRNSDEDKKLRSKLSEVNAEFMSQVGDTAKFSELEDDSLKWDKLYLPFNEIVASFINSSSIEAENVQYYFNFLVGNVDYYKVIMNEPKNVMQVQNFTDYEIPTSVTAKLKKDKKNYIFLEFSNGWEFKMRLHTASSRIGKKASLKYDTVGSDLPIKIEDFHY